MMTKNDEAREARQHPQARAEIERSTQRVKDFAKFVGAEVEEVGFDHEGFERQIPDDITIVQMAIGQRGVLQPSYADNAAKAFNGARHWLPKEFLRCVALSHIELVFAEFLFLLAGAALQRPD
jgi:hypothetical protein